MPRAAKENGNHGGLLFGAVCLLAAAGLFAAYSNHFDNGFHFDDSHVIVDNLSIRGLHDVPRFFTDPLTFTSLPTNAVYRPLLTLSFAIDYHLGGGLEPHQFHRTQFALLLLLGLLLVLVFQRIYDRAAAGPWNRWIALAAATLFCIHTANTETVNYLSARSSLVATLAVVGSFLLYQAWPRGRRMHFYLLPMLIGGLAKPLTVMFAPLLFIFILIFGERGTENGERGAESDGRGAEDGRRGTSPLARALARSAPAFVAGGLLYLFLRAMDSETLEYSTIDRWTYARTQPFVWLHYLRLFLFPRGLTADTDWAWVRGWLDLRLLVGGLFIVLLVGAVVWLATRPRWRPAAFGLAWFAVALLPTSSIIPLSEVYNEHRIFFPYVGLACAAAWAIALGLRSLLRSRVAVAIGALIALAVVSAHGIGTHQRNRVWKDETTLWRDVTVKSPRNGRGLMNYGLTQMRAGELEQAREYYERAVAILPDYPVLLVNLGIVTSALDEPGSAEEHFLRALELNPDYGQGHYYYARWLVEHERAPEALPHLVRALEISPGDVNPNRMLLDLYAAVGAADALAGQIERVLGFAPADPAATAYAENRNPFEAVEETAEGYSAAGLERIHRRKWLESAVLYRLALRLEPSDSSHWNNLGWALGSAGFPHLAVPCFERALELDPASELAGNNLRWAIERHRVLHASP